MINYLTAPFKWFFKLEAASGLILLIAAIAGFTWILIEARRLQMKHSWLYLLTGCCVAFAFAFPLFLFMRERHLLAQKINAT